MLLGISAAFRKILSGEIKSACRIDHAGQKYIFLYRFRTTIIIISNGIKQLFKNAKIQMPTSSRTPLHRSMKNHIIRSSNTCTHESPFGHSFLTTHPEMCWRTSALSSSPDHTHIILINVANSTTDNPQHTDKKSPIPIKSVTTKTLASCLISFLRREKAQDNVNTSAPCSITAIVCSKWAARE